MQETPQHSSLAKGVLAGVVAGLVATAAKAMAEKLYPPRTHGEPEPPAALAEELAGHSLEQGAKAVASEGIHWAFGAAAGAAYGAVAEFYPAITAKEGVTFGLMLMSLTHRTALPALGLSAAADEQTPREQTSEAATHIVYGVVAERVRRTVRGLLD